MSGQLAELTRSAYVPRTSWSGLGALIATAAILILSFFFAGLFVNATTNSGGTNVIRDVVRQATFEVAFHFAAFALVLFAASWGGTARRNVLALDAPLPSWIEILAAVSGLIVILGSMALLQYVIARDTAYAGFQSIHLLVSMGVLHRKILILSLFVPIAQELLFRGFLQSALARVPSLGFWGATAITALAWIPLTLGIGMNHLLLSSSSTVTVAAVWPALMKPLIVGIYFCWLLQRTGSLWLPLICNVIGQSCLMLMLYLRLLPL